MNERDELALLKEQQARLEQELGVLSIRLKRLERHLQGSEAEGPAQAQPIQLSSTPAAQTSPSHEAARPLRPSARPGEGFTPPVQPSLTPAPQPISAVPPVIAQVSGGPPFEVKTPGTPHVELEKAPAERSLELRLGTYWAPRIGIVVLLTGLVFIGNLAYERLGPLGKVLLLYLASAILLGGGSWWQRNAKETLKNYAQVLFAGGLAALYFTTYGAYHLKSLQVIHSPVLDGVLLLGCAGFMVYTADRWRSEILAMFGIGLAYYTCIMTPVGHFTLFSNLLLTGAAVFFLVRNRWVALTFGSLLASYAAYGFWRFFSENHWHWASPSEGLWSGTYFLVCYWIVFTTGVFLSRDEKFAGPNRAGFLTLNNGAFFSMFLLTMLQVNTGGFWRFCLVYGAVLLVLAETARRVLADESAPKKFYLTQGLLLVTIGLISKFAGLQLALILAAESVVLLMLAQTRRSVILLTSAYIVAGLAVGWAIDGMKQNDPTGIYLGMGIGALMLVNTLLVNRQMSTTAAKLASGQSQSTNPMPGLDVSWIELSGVGGAPSASVAGAVSRPAPIIVRPEAGYFALLALVVWLVATYDNVSHENFPLVLAAEGLLLSFSVYLLGAREISLFSQGYVLLAQLAWFVRWMENPSLPWWNPLLLILMTLALSHWWQRQKVLAAPPELAVLWQVVYALGIVGLLYFWLGHLAAPSAWLGLTILLAVGLTAYGVLTRAWWIAACGQLFVLVSAAQFVWQLWQTSPGWLIALAPITGIGLLSWATVQWFRSRPDSNPRVREPLLQIARLYRWVALPMCVAWVCQYIPERERIWVLTLLGFAVFAFAGWTRSREALLYSAGFSATALVLFWFPIFEGSTIYWANLGAILLLLVQQQIAKRAPERYPSDLPLHGAVILAGGLSLWWFCTRWVLEQASGFYLTASWSLLALAFFTCGIVVRERVYRWLGLGLLACALGRIVIIDVWRLETLYRILSFMALGIVLLVLGFVYSKYQEKIRQWL